MRRRRKRIGREGNCIEEPKGWSQFFDEEGERRGEERKERKERKEDERCDRVGLPFGSYEIRDDEF